MHDMPNVESQSSISETRNSAIRERIAGPIDRIAGALHGKFPDLTANELTLMGTIGVAIGSAIAAGRNPDDHKEYSKHTAISLGITIASVATDALDGALARKIAAEDPQKTNHNGHIVDAISDRAQELILSLSRAISAGKRRDPLGEFAALSAGVTSPLPSIIRAFSEKKGNAVPESGKGIIGLAGTRVGRAFLGIVATEFPEIKKVPVQFIADALVTGANVITAAQRLKASQKQEDHVLSEGERTDAKKRFKALLTFAGMSAGATALFYYLNHRK